MEPGVYTAIAGGLATVSIFSVIKVITIFLKHINRAEERQERFLSNHMSQNVKTLEASVRAQEHVADRLERLEDVVRASPTVRVTAADEVEVKP